MKKLSLLLILAISTSVLLTTCKKEENKVELPTISTLAVTEITATTAKSGANITNDGGGEITSKGILWSTSQNPNFEQHTGLTIEGAGAGLFQAVLTDLTQNTTYFVRAYATNNAGTAYGSQVQFKTELGAPEAAFIASHTSGKAPLTVNFTDQSTNNPTSWLWDFGDGNSSPTQNPQHIYQNAETYTVQLTVTNIHGSDTEIKTNYVSVTIGQPCPGIPTVTDIDGNVYNTVLIGEQCWMKENLKTTQYRNGTPIEYPGDDNIAWQNNTTGAYAWFMHDIGWKDSYGALYNWHAVNNATGLCPTGWHVPSDAEWTQLVDYVVAQGFPNQWNNPNGTGKALKSCRQVNSPLGGDCNTAVHPRWSSHNTHHGIDEFGFSGLPGGYRSNFGASSHIGSLGEWWTSTEYSSFIAWARGLDVGAGGVRMGSEDKRYGYSIRCLKDE